MRYSAAFHRLRRQIARRRRDLLRKPSGRHFIYPPLGSAWLPSDRELALCEAFIVLFVAELETYWEYTINTGLDAYQTRFLASGLQTSKAAEGYMKSIVETRDKFKKNNNANWKRISSYFNFIGLDEGLFPSSLWDHVEKVVVHRGDIVHNSGGMRSLTDPRGTLSHIENCLSLLMIFDRDYHKWLEHWNADIVRMNTGSFGFVPGLGSICM